MISTRLRYHRPDTVEDAAQLLAAHAGDAAVIGGGTMVLPLMTRDEISVSHAVDLRGAGLTGIETSGEGVRIGSMVTYSDALDSRLVALELPLLSQMASVITGGSQLRNQATLGGAAAYANPSSDVPGVLVALEATFTVCGSAGRRSVAAADFFVGAYSTAMEPGEVLEAFTIRPREGRYGYGKIKLSEGSWPIATASACLAPTGPQGSVTVGAVEAVPFTVDISSAMDEAGQVDLSVVDALVLDRVRQPWEDVLADGDYRRAIAGVVARRAVHSAQQRSISNPTDKGSTP